MIKKQTNEIIIDAGFLIALLNRKDHYHKKAKELIRKLPRKRWISTWLVITEVSHILVKQGAPTAVRGLLDLCENGGINLFHLESNHIPRLRELLKKYQSLPADLADVSLVILAEDLGHGEILSTDLRDFNTYRWKNHKPFCNLFNCIPK